MRRRVFVIAVFGMFVLLSLMIFSGSKNIENYSDLEGMIDNQKVIVSGEVTSERILYSDVRALELDSGIELICEGCESFKGENVSVEGIVESYNWKKQINVLKISVE